MLAQITWGYSFEFTSNYKHIYSYPISPGEILIDCTSKSNEKCNVVSRKFHLRLLIWQIEEIDVRKLRIWRLSISGVFIFWSNESQRLEMTKLIPKCLCGFMVAWAFCKVPWSKTICVVRVSISSVLIDVTKLYLEKIFVQCLWFFYVQHFKCYQNIAIYVLCVYFGSYLCCHSITYHRIKGKLVNSPLQQRPTFKDHAIFLDEQQTEKWVRSQEKKKISLSLNNLGNSPVGYRLLFWLFFGELDDSAPSAVEPDTRGFLFPFFFLLD